MVKMRIRLFLGRAFWGERKREKTILNVLLVSHVGREFA